MITRHLLVAFAIVVASTMSVSTECVILTAKQVMSQPSFEIVFSGRVVDVKAAGANGYRATFEVDRVWKGTVPARIDLYVPPSPAEVPRFNKGTRYVAVAHKMTSGAARKMVGLSNDPARVAYAPAACSDALERDFEKLLGAGYEPQR